MQGVHAHAGKGMFVTEAAEEEVQLVLPVPLVPGMRHAFCSVGWEVATASPCLTGMPCYMPMLVCSPMLMDVHMLMPLTLVFPMGKCKVADGACSRLSCKTEDA